MPRRSAFLLVPFALLLLALAGCNTATGPGGPGTTSTPPTWTSQYGTAQFDIAFGVGTDAAGNSYLTGDTTGTFSGQTNAGSSDVYVRKVDSSGTAAWTTQFGTAAGDVGQAVATDASGNSYVTGFTSGTFTGQTNAGMSDAFLAKVDGSGSVLWVKEFGSSASDAGNAVAVDGSGNIYVAGSAGGLMPGAGFAAGQDDYFLAKFDSSGNRLWLAQDGTSAMDEGLAVGVDASGNSYVAGVTTGSLGGANAGGDDAFLAKYDSSGTMVWGKQFGGSGDDDAMGLAVDGSGNAYVTGGTASSLGGNSNAGNFDVFLAKFTSSGNRSWLTQFGTSADEEGNGVAVDGSGNAYVTGYATGSLAGTNAGKQDAFVAKVDASGNRGWTSQFGTSADDAGKAVSVDSNGDIVVGGFTDGKLGSAALGGTDAFAAQFAP